MSETLGGLDIVCNNAGITQATPLGDYTPEDFDKVISINIKSVLNGCQAAARLFEAAGTKGVIINTSSMVGTFGQTSGMGYPASKFAMNGIPRSLARELGSNGIRVNAAAPGIPATDMVAALPDEIKPLIAQIPLCRVGEPVDWPTPSCSSRATWPPTSPASSSTSTARCRCSFLAPEANSLGWPPAFSVIDSPRGSQVTAVNPKCLGHLSGSCSFQERGSCWCCSRARCRVRGSQPASCWRDRQRRNRCRGLQRLLSR